MTRIKNNRTSRPWMISMILVVVLVLNGNFISGAYAEGYAASIGGVNYQTLDEAVTAVTDGQTIKLLSDIEVGTGGESGVVQKPGIHFYLDLGGKTISGNSDTGVLKLTAGEVTVYDGIITNNNVNGQALLAEGDEARFSYPTGFTPTDEQAAQMDIPAAYHVTIDIGSNGTVHYGSTTGPLVTADSETLYAGENTAHQFYFVPNTGYVVGSLAIDGVATTVAKSYSISNLTADRTIKVTYKIITYTITPKVYAGDVSASQWVVLSPTSATVKYGGNQTFTFTVKEGYKLKDVLVNGVSQGAVTTIALTNVTKKTTVTIELEKTALFIMLDAGHYAYYNHSPVVATYYEGNVMWTLHKYVKQALEEYPNIIVDTTRANNTKELGSTLDPYERGKMGKGYDLVLSLHSNAASVGSIDYVVGLCSLDSKVTAVSKGLGLKLVNTVSTVMDTKQISRIYTKAQSDGRDWYGVNRGAAAVGVPSIILEHSFHTNTRSALWLLKDANLQSLAAAEAKTIADYYGITKTGEVAAPKTPTSFNAYGATYSTAKILWNKSSGASGYQIYRATSSQGTYVKIKTTSQLSYIDANLTCGKNYYYKVRAYRKTFYGTKYSSFTEVNPAKPRPAKPGVTVVAGIDKAVLKWTSVAGANGYYVYRKSGTTGAYVKVKKITSKDVLKWSNTHLTTGRTYTYRVCGYRIVSGKIVEGRLSTPDTVKIK